jgi:AbiV family abortive infection protein
MSDKLQDGRKFMEAVESVELRPRAHRLTSGDFNLAARHVLRLLTDATEAFARGSYGTAAFLAITALEETAKAEMTRYQRGDPDGERVKGKHPLRDHATKHILGVSPVLFMGDRLLRVLGRERCEALKAEIDAGGFVGLREASIYVNFDVSPVVGPNEAVRFDRAFEVLLLALESADDTLVGYTNASYEIGAQIVKLAARLESISPLDLQR